MTSNKYLKYKNKYIELKKQIAGVSYLVGKEKLSFPKDWKKINYGDKILINNVSYTKKNNDSDVDIKNLIDCRASVLEIYDKGLYLDKIYKTIGKNAGKPFFEGDLNLTKNLHINTDNYDDLIIEFQIDEDKNESNNEFINEKNIDNVELINMLKEKISNLESKIEKLESNLKNHYHDVPTTGMKLYDEQHPYFRKS